MTDCFSTRSERTFPVMSPPPPQLAEVHALLGAEVDRHASCGRMHLDVEDLQRDATAAREALRRHDPALLTLAPFAILARLVIRREPHDTSVELVALVLGHRPSR